MSCKQHVEQVCNVTGKQVLVVIGNRHVCQQSQSGQLHGRVQGTREDVLTDLIDVYLKAIGGKISIGDSPKFFYQSVSFLCHGGGQVFRRRLAPQKDDISIQPSNFGDFFFFKAAFVNASTVLSILQTDLTRSLRQL